MDYSERAIVRDVRAYLNRSSRHRSECAALIVALALRELRPNAVRSNGGWAVSDTEFKRLWTLVEQGHPGWLREQPRRTPQADTNASVLSNEMGSVQWSFDGFNAKPAKERMALSDRYKIEFDEARKIFIGHPRH